MAQDYAAQDHARQRLLVGVLAFVIGLAVGLLLAWQVWPVQWTNTDPCDLRPQHQRDYVLMTANSWAMTGDGVQAQYRLRELMDDDTDWSDVASLVEEVAQEQTSADNEDTADRIRAMVEAVELPATEPPAEETQDTQEGGLVGRRAATFIALGIALLVFAGMAWYLYSRNRPAESEATGEALSWGSEPSIEPEPQQVTEEEEEVSNRGADTVVDEVSQRPIEDAYESGAGADYAGSEGVALAGEDLVEEDEELDYAPTGEDVLGIFDTEYNFGDDDFYHAFTLESPEGQFVGQCGVVISDVLGLDEAQQVDAFDVWLFEAQGTRTISKVLASEYACRNESLNAKLSRKGELVEARQGLIMTLETETLHLSAIIKDYGYRQDPQLDRAIFSHLAVELTVEQVT